VHGEPGVTGLRGEHELSTREPDPDNTGGGIADMEFLRQVPISRSSAPYWSSTFLLRSVSLYEEEVYFAHCHRRQWLVKPAHRPPAW
jgi:hypothetical protein